MAKRLAKPILVPFWWIYVAVTSVIGLVLGLVGIGAGLYVGGWVMLFGGLADVINLFKGYDPVSASDVAIALTKVIFAIPVGIFIASIGLKLAGKIEESWDKKPWFVKAEHEDIADESTYKN